MVAIAFSFAGGLYTMTQWKWQCDRGNGYIHRNLITKKLSLPQEG